MQQDCGRFFVTYRKDSDISWYPDNIAEEAKLLGLQYCIQYVAVPVGSARGDFFGAPKVQYFSIIKPVLFPGLIHQKSRLR